MRDGQLIGAAPVRELDQDRVVRMMVGRELAPWAEEVFSKAGGSGMIRVVAGEAVNADEDDEDEGSEDDDDEDDDDEDDDEDEDEDDDEDQAEDND